ncbi:MAG: DNA-3-methyladenine glycosylase [Bacteroidota bacterium]|nr:DNA-3-methyladenine glycosylase [Bacteroidota bacterium]
MSREVPMSFYRQADVVKIARELLGKSLFTESRGVVTGGIITETEAYAGVTDKASHAYGGRYTERTKIMYREGGCAYIYLCYGIHSLFNVVTNIEGIPDAVLIRGLMPTTGIEVMLERRGMKKAGPDFCKGPGKVSKALDIHYSHSGLLLSAASALNNETGMFEKTATDENPPCKLHPTNLIKLLTDEMKIWIEENDRLITDGDILVSPRIGVDYAEEDALRPYRFELKTKTF